MEAKLGWDKFKFSAAAAATADADAKVPSHRAMGRMPQWRATVAFTRRLKSSAGSTGLEPRGPSLGGS